MYITIQHHTHVFEATLQNVGSTCREGDTYTIVLNTTSLYRSSQRQPHKESSAPRHLNIDGFCSNKYIYALWYALTLLA